MSDKTSDGLRKTFDAILAELLKTIGASRTTLRLDDAQYGFHIDDVVAEALAPGETSLRGQTSINQRAAATAQWVEKNRRLLVQSDLSSGEPRAPEALIRLYGVRAQMLAPIEREGRLDGWISVHEARGPRKLDRAGSGRAAQGGRGRCCARSREQRDRRSTMRLKGKTAIVTGGGQGLGEGMALRFAQEGANIAVVDKNPETTPAVAKTHRAGRRQGDCDRHRSLSGGEHRPDGRDDAEGVRPRRHPRRRASASSTSRASRTPPKRSGTAISISICARPSSACAP